MTSISRHHLPPIIYTFYFSWHIRRCMDVKSCRWREWGVTYSPGAQSLGLTRRVLCFALFSFLGLSLYLSWCRRLHQPPRVRDDSDLSEMGTSLRARNTPARHQQQKPPCLCRPLLNLIEYPTLEFLLGRIFLSECRKTRDSKSPLLFFHRQHAGFYPLVRNPKYRVSAFPTQIRIQCRYTIRQWPHPNGSRRFCQWKETGSGRISIYPHLFDRPLFIITRLFGNYLELLAGRSGRWETLLVQPLFFSILFLFFVCVHMQPSTLSSTDDRTIDGGRKGPLFPLGAPFRNSLGRRLAAKGRPENRRRNWTDSLVVELFLGSCVRGRLAQRWMMCCAFSEPAVSRRAMKCWMLSRRNLLA
ncbi:hypothetical protein SODALDRAFT_178529 [Sodiomyces alkalinus F11]|uniref:Uncharacterized protein n=1 Tax=Sodiomyces alkalinus (strain CBS 110278 / VKM F-3762 / F11) TaxID=1314773 RepID=A0A3N2PTZ1_SODAK|nr:hypothetical protein SODALDRAFT_178529 [Sodiomyces alkalinus F11]ROT37973.1 hypothetical protein SODALDRAFT_178529 [Sodiomyces alkalinus F11]